ncbi:uncharacterized protein LOC111373927 [Olea europaea var. sylvestris]|uniref:J domain-containing protein n=1 Tax=Olea europaea subsp. europaea TaxID=158383 RepID=A0A8S0RI92_OLEEU|nr:uncharacterized protein LOC111373927 [Olea europaea var. sylvestris]XP_022852288.1 uncharacterized protein LOC111373927 [Olea europaea var. sylvestris]CAA2978722.1 Hypothetical predicted protein [Olea europaea subsp. europaea]
MECNKDDAIKCKGLAEKKIKNQDIVGANKFALKAQSLFPNLEGLSALLEVINLYVASQKKINGEVDLYGIFGLDSSVDDDTLRKKYRKMALVFHPDKNKSAGAAGAFLILSEAWKVLSDKDKRSAYHLKLNLRARNPTFPADRNSFCNFTSSCSSQNARNMSTDTKPQQMPTKSRTSATATSSPYNPPLWPKNSRDAAASRHVPRPKRTEKGATSSRYAATPPRPRNPRTATTALNIPNSQKTSKTGTRSFVRTPSQPRNRTTAQHTPTSNPHAIPCPPPGPETFWTSCTSCRLQYEYPKIYLNQNLLCISCREAFFAIQKPAPPAGSIHSSPGCCALHHQKTGMSGASGNSGSVTASYIIAAQIAQRVQSGFEGLKRGREEVVAMAGSEEALQKNNIAPDTTDTPSASEKPMNKRHVDGQKWNDAKEGNPLTAHNMAAHKISLEI